MGLHGDGEAAMTDSSPFRVDEDKAFDALLMVWGDAYDDITFSEGYGWSAHWIGAPDSEQVTGATPDELNRNLRLDWLRRQGVPAHHGRYPHQPYPDCP